MLTRLRYCTRLAFLDLWRLWPSVRSHVIIVAGICLPLLLLLGLKRGHVAMLREEFVRSPSGRRIMVWPGQKGDLLRKSAVQRLQQQLTATDVIISVAEHVVTLSHRDANGTIHKVAEASLFSTAPGDPELGIYGTDVLVEGDHRAVVGQELASQLGAKAGDRLTLRLTRKNGDPAETEIEIAAVTEGPNRDVAYITVDFHNQIQQFLNGQRIAELGWPSAGIPVEDGYAGYMLFCLPSDDLKPKDHETLGRSGYKADPVTDKDVRTLYGILRPDHDLRVWFVHTEESANNPKARVNDSPTKIMSKIDTNSIALFWNDALMGTIRGRPYRVVGCTFPRTWLRRYLTHPENILGDDNEKEFLLRFPTGALLEEGNPLRMTVIRDNGPSCTVEVQAEGAGRPLRSTQIASLVGCLSCGRGPIPGFGNLAALRAADAVPDAPLAVAVVPVHLLAHLTAVLDRRAQFDPAKNCFVAIPDKDLTCPHARLYAHTIDDVVEVERQLTARGYQPVSSASRILEIHKQDQSLEFIVIAVGLGVWLFGIFTVYNVLNESTARKRGMIGILRVMGVPWLGVFYLILLRALVLGLIAGVLTVAFGVLLPWPLAHVPSLRGSSILMAVAAVAGAVSGVLWLIRDWGQDRSPSANPTASGLWKSRAAWLFLAVAATCGGIEFVSWCIDFQPIIVLSRSGEMAWVLASAVTCCVLGSLLPAWESSRLDPFEAIVEGKFRRFLAPLGIGIGAVA